MSLAEADYGMTELAMGGNQGRYMGDERLLVRFFVHPRLDRQLSASMERPMFEDVDYIQIMQPGNKDSIVIRPAMEMDKTRFAEHYRKYRARQDQDHIEGTLLEEWPQITRSQVEELKFFNIRTVEQLIGVSDSNAQSIMGFGALQASATAFLETLDGHKDKAELEAKLSERDDKIDALMARLEALENDDTPLEAQPDMDGALEELDAATEQHVEEPVAEETPKRRRKNKKTE
jgi:hypothetical protein